MAIQIDYESFAAAGIQEELPRDLLENPSGADPGVARRRVEAVLEERRVRLELASLDMDSFEFDLRA